MNQIDLLCIGEPLLDAALKAAFAASIAVEGHCAIAPIPTNTALNKAMMQST